MRNTEENNVRRDQQSNAMRSTRATMFAQFVVRRISIRDTDISVIVSPKLIENDKTQLVGRAPSPIPALVLLLMIKNIN
jgi:hypothetical protein